MPKPIHSRDHRIDMLRGIALVMIFINHIPETAWEHFTSRNFGFSDAAEGFVLMSGMAAGLAYGAAYLRGTPSLAQIVRPWQRAVTLWWVHCIIIFSVLAFFIFLIDQPGIHSMAYDRNILFAVEDPAKLSLAMATLGHHFAYADILPLYIVLMLAAPFLLFVCARWPNRALLGSVLLWLCVGVVKLKMPTWPTDYGWSFNPMAWQLLFVAGILTGFALRQGRRFLPAKRWAVWLAIGYLVFAMIWTKVPVVAEHGGHTLWLLYEYAGVPSLFTAFDKCFVSLPRLLHILALAYVLSVLPVVKTMSAHPMAAPFSLLGRNSLPVFAVGSVLAYIGQLTKALQPPSAVLDAVLIISGLAVLFLVAQLREMQRRPKAVSHMGQASTA
ncbi:OpgC family protein [Pseudorhodobacter sp. W20_MBD10_FR17]|uniref:OpgC family protein n=1 Tax=Pseudorhodobacter sp. W20_MBD10_FR17 TaxID=3240266 RepID=UPI003F9537B7